MLSTKEIFDHIMLCDPDKATNSDLLLLRSILRTPGYPSITGKIVAEHLALVTGRSHIYLIGDPQEDESLESILSIHREWAGGNVRLERAQVVLREAITTITAEQDRSIREMFLWSADGYLSMLEGAKADTHDLRRALRAVSITYDARDLPSPR